ncbi:DNA cytosine methyltransferase [Faecalicatena fissicatena]|jgi:DNA (cytosine-5-)-methyltransferase|uniref:DNA cytosine methyltransferase n=1 Tax=Faecalicatena fissicatena TaxID=290055 RepID=UPI00156FCC7F|nr:DNA cytosine methyltransferase [Faecalicatena fissicatena]NSE34251.1 DNA cytosine methyltransferase [Faecalicatena fissicatena]
MAFSYIDIFAGAGGLSEGFQRNGYIPVAHVEMKKEACLTLKTRECFYYLKKHGRIEDYKNYLRREITRDELYAMVPETVLNSVINETMSEEGMPALFDRIDQLMEVQGIENIDVLVGGPPCQAYSLVGRARSKTNMVGDPRNYLYMLYCEVLEKYRPKIFVFENVPGLLTANGGSYFDDMRERFRKAGYFLEYRILNSKEYGVLQNRRRVIVIGWREGTDFTYPELDKKEQKYLVDDLFSDLPYIEPGESRNVYKCKSTEYLRESGIRTEDDILTLHQARPNLERDRKIYRQVIEAWNNGQKRLKYTELPEELCTHNNRTAFLDRFKVVAKDMPYAQTMVAHISKDGHYFIHPDIKQARSISVREAARIQSFPDNYFFEGGRTASFLQIGNAVPPLMASAIAKKLKEQLMEEEANG